MSHAPKSSSNYMITIYHYICVKNILNIFRIDLSQNFIKYTPKRSKLHHLKKIVGGAWIPQLVQIQKKFPSPLSKYCISPWWLFYYKFSLLLIGMFFHWHSFPSWHHVPLFTLIFYILVRQQLSHTSAISSYSLPCSNYSNHPHCYKQTRFNKSVICANHHLNHHLNLPLMQWVVLFHSTSSTAITFHSRFGG